MKKMAMFYGGKIDSSLPFLEAAKKLSIDLDLISFKEVYFDVGVGGERGVGLRDGRKLNDYRVIYFKLATKHWEEVNMIVDAVGEDTIIIDPVLKRGRPTDICKVHQMIELSKAGLNVPRSVYGNLKYLRENVGKYFEYPVILKGSRGDRRSQVTKIYSDEDWGRYWDNCKKMVREENQRYMLQEYIENTEDYRVMVLGDKVLGVMKRGVGENVRLKNVFTRAELPDEVLKLAVEAARVCGIAVAGVDVVLVGEKKEPYFWEVNKSPNFVRFAEVTGINVPEEIVKYLAEIA